MRGLGDILSRNTGVGGSYGGMSGGQDLLGGSHGFSSTASLGSSSVPSAVVARKPLGAIGGRLPPDVPSQVSSLAQPGASTDFMSAGVSLGKNASLNPIQAAAGGAARRNHALATGAAVLDGYRRHGAGSTFASAGSYSLGGGNNTLGNSNGLGGAGAACKSFSWLY